MRGRQGTSISVALLALGCLLFTSCTDPVLTLRHLTAAGYSRIEVTGYKVFDCDKNDLVRTGFRARNESGDLVVGSVCCGLVFRDCKIVTR